MHAYRTNRTVLLLLGLLMTAAGVAALLAAYGAFGSAMAARVLADSSFSRYVGDNGGWLWPVVAAVALIVFLLAVRWLIAILFSTDRVRTLPLRTGRATDRITLAAPAVANAVREEIESDRVVRSAKVWLVGNPEQPLLAVNVDTDRDTDLGRLRDRIEQGALVHARQALDRPDLRVRLDLNVSRQQGARVA
jgi:hypothetical protein